MKCANCGKLILDKGITYGINPTAICKCDNPKPVTPPDQDNSQTKMAKDLIQKFKPALTELQDSSTGGLREKINSLVDKYADVSIGDGQGGIDGYDYTIVDKLLDLIQSETDKALEAYKAEHPVHSTVQTAPMKVNGMKYCRVGNRNVYSCGHYQCR